MHLELENAKNSNAIQSYQEGAIKIRDITYENDIIVSPSVVEPWVKADLNELEFDQLCKHKPDLIILGTGTTPLFLNQNNLLKLQQQGIGIEVMTTAAACRTFNVLLSEERNVLAALKV